MTEAEVLALINLHIVPNGNNEITANVLRPILIDILGQPNDKIGDLTALNTTDKTRIVNAVNELTNTLNSGFNIHEGTLDPNVTPPASFSIGDWYIRSGISLYQYNGDIWVLLSSVPIVLPAPQDLQSVLDTGNAVTSPLGASTAQFKITDVDPIFEVDLSEDVQNSGFGLIRLSKQGFLLTGGDDTTPFSNEILNGQITRTEYTTGKSTTLGIQNPTAIGVNVLLSTPSNAPDTATYTIPLSVNGVFADVDGNIPVTGANSSIGTGTVIDLSNPLVTYYNMESASSSLVYTLGTIVNGGKARLLVNAPSLPAITGAINIKGDAFQTNTDIYLEVENSNGRIEYWVKQISASPAVDLTALPFGKIVDLSTAASTDYIGTPCIIETSTGRFITSHDIYGATAVKEGWGTIQVSDDLGQTFTKVLEVAGLFWGNLFEYGGNIYIIYSTGFAGSGSYLDADIALRYSTDNGDTWSAETILFADDGSMLGYLTHANKPLIRDGYVAMSVSKRVSTTNFASSIDVGILYGNLTDLTNPLNYSLSSFQSLNTSLYPLSIGTTATATKRPSNALATKGHLEPCLVDDGSNIRLFCRLEQTPNSNYGVYYNITWNSLNPPLSTISTTPNYHEMPGGHIKFQIKYDSISSKFWSIVNWNRAKYFTDNRYELYLAYSLDGIDWEICQKVGGWDLSSNWENEITLKGTQYASFVIIGNDIYFTARTTSDNGQNQHDADAMTISRIENFRSSIPQTFIEGSLIVDENSSRLEDVNGIALIFDRSKYQNSPYMLNANNANKVSWASGLNFTGSQYMRVPHNEFLDPATNGISVFVVIENLQSTAAFRILSKSDGVPTTTFDINPKDWSFNPQGISIGDCYTSAFTDISIGNDYILASSYDKTTNSMWNYRNGVNRGLPPNLEGGTWSVDHINKTNVYTGQTTAELYIGRRNVGSALSFSSNIKAIHVIPKYMTPTEMVAYQTALNTIYTIY